MVHCGAPIDSLPCPNQTYVVYAYGPQRGKTYLHTYAPKEDLNQPNASAKSGPEVIKLDIFTFISRGIFMLSCV